MRVAAVGDIHVGLDADGRFADPFSRVHEHADVLLLAGDLTRCGTPEEAANVVRELAGVTVPVVAVLGNHDHHADRAAEVAGVLTDAGVCVLEGDTTVLDLDGARLGVAGVKGFGGGFAGGHATAFGEREMKAFVEHTHTISGHLGAALARLAADDCDARIALLHYSPTPDTLEGEPLQIYPFLGSQLLASAVDQEGADLVLHGHAHAGSHEGRTPGGIPVRNVALPVLGRAYCVFELGGGDGRIDGQALTRSARAPG